MVGVGLISFPLYLWHWPLLAFAHVIEAEPALDAETAGPDADAAQGAGLLLASCTLSTLTRADIGSPVELRPEVLLRAMTTPSKEGAPPITNLDPQLRDPPRVG